MSNELYAAACRVIQYTNNGGIDATLLDQLRSALDSQSSMRIADALEELCKLLPLTPDIKNEIHRAIVDVDPTP